MKAIHDHVSIAQAYKQHARNSKRALHAGAACKKCLI